MTEPKIVVNSSDIWWSAPAVAVTSAVVGLPDDTELKLVPARPLTRSDIAAL